MNKLITEIGKKHLENLCYGRDHDTSIINSLILVNHAFENCLSDGLKTCKTTEPSTKRQYSELVKRIRYTNGQKGDDGSIRVIENKRLEYLRSNPQNCSIKDWERIAYKICKEVGFKVIIEDISKKQCDIAFEIQRESIPIKCLISLFIVEKLEECKIKYNIEKGIVDECEFDFKILKSTKEQCQIDYKMFIEQVNNCNLSFNEYYNLNKKGLNFHALREIYNNSLSVRLVSGKVELVGKMNQYTVGKDLSFKDNSSILTIDDRIEYLKKITEDLNLPDEVIKEIFAN